MNNLLNAIDFSKLNANDIFGGLTLVQIAVFFVCIILAILVGLFLGACIFYLVGVKSCLKQIQKKKAEKMASQESKQLEEYVTNQESHKVQTSSLDYTENDYLLDDIIDDEIIDDDIIDDNSLLDKGASGELFSVVNTDKDYIALVEKRKAEVPVVSRNYLVNKIYSMSVVSDKINIEVFSPTEEEPYVRVTAGGCPFLYVFVMKKVMKVFMRVHQATYKSLKEKAGEMVEPAPNFGEDWYSLILSDFPNSVAIATNIIKLSYRYTAQKEFEKNDKGIVYKGTPYADKVKAAADKYNPYLDSQFIAVVKDLQRKYNIAYFGKSEACAFTRKLAGKEKPTAIEFVGNRPAILKAGETMFAIMFENYGVSKLIFRADEKYVDALKAKHDYVKESEFPKSENWKWYSILIDKTYTDKDVRQVIQDSYNYVLNFLAKANYPDIDDMDIDV